jgi:hypothetical protein
VVSRRSSGAIGLLAAAVGGVFAAEVLPERFDRRGGLAVLAGVTVLLSRDAAMVLGGAPARLKDVPRVLLFLELASAGVATLVGAAAWLGPREWARSAHPGQITVTGAASGASALTFLVHAARQAIYLTPSRGLREPSGRDERSGT